MIISKYLKFLILTAICIMGFCLVSACTNEEIMSSQSNTAPVQIPNPWKDCGQDLNLAAKTAGFTLPMKLSNYTVRAMKDMIEVTYPLDEFRDVTIRKSSTEINNGDISGDYNIYPVKEDVKLDNGVIITIRRDNKKIYVMYFSAEQGYYSASCKYGMTLDEVQKIYEILAEVEAPEFP